ncbi:MAG: MerR family transcriptional regulator [Thiothrix sp.]|nr:MerR family transcriptional regulator [Thiothrix sp.]
MLKSELNTVLTGEILDEGREITLVELCRTCSVQAETIEALVEYGILEPSGRHGSHWHFQATSIRRARTALRLRQHLGVNLAGAALALELMERIEGLEQRLRIAGSQGY